MISVPTGTQIWIAAGVTDLRQGFDGLSAIQTRRIGESVLWPRLSFPRPARRPY